MNQEDLDHTFTFKLADWSVKKIDELNKEQLEEAKRLIDKALEDLEPKEGFKKFIKLNKCFVVGFYDEETSIKELEKAKAWQRLRDKGFERVFSLGLRDALCGGKTVEFKLLVDDKDSIEDIKVLFGGEE